MTSFLSPWIQQRVLSDDAMSRDDNTRCQIYAVDVNRCAITIHDSDVLVLCKLSDEAMQSLEE